MTDYLKILRTFTSFSEQVLNIIVEEAIKLDKIEELTDWNFRDYVTKRDQLSGIVASVRQTFTYILTIAVTEEFKNSINNLIENLVNELVRHNNNISRFQKYHQHRWRAAYREDGETHGICLICGSQEWVPSRTCGY